MFTSKSCSYRIGNGVKNNEFVIANLSLQLPRARFIVNALNQMFWQLTRSNISKNSFMTAITEWKRQDIPIDYTK